MADITELVLKVNADGVDKAKKKVDDFSSAMKDTEKTSSTLEKGLSGTTKGASALGGVLSKIAVPIAVVTTLKQVAKIGAECTEAWKNQERQLKLLNSQLEATGAMAWTSVDALSSLATELQRTTNYGDEEIERMQSVLLSFRNVTDDVFTRTNKAALDLATVMGTDITSAAQALGKALNDPAKGMDSLSRQGIRFSEQEKAIIKDLTEAGRLAEAQNMILDEVNNRFGGAAQSVADPFIQAKNAMGDLKEELGHAITNALNLNGIFNGMKTVIEAMTDKLHEWNEVRDTAKSIKEIEKAFANGTLNSVNDLGGIENTLDKYRKEYNDLRKQLNFATDEMTIADIKMQMESIREFTTALTNRKDTLKQEQKQIKSETNLIEEQTNTVANLKKTWQEVFAQTTNTQSVGSNDTWETVGRKYGKSLQKGLQDTVDVSSLLGMSSDTTGGIQNEMQKLRRDMQSLLSIEASEDFTDTFEKTDRIIKDMARQYKELTEKYVDSYVDDLEKEVKLLEKGNTEREIALRMEQGFTEEQAKRMVYAERNNQWNNQVSSLPNAGTQASSLNDAYFSAYQDRLASLLGELVQTTDKGVRKELENEIKETTKELEKLSKACEKASEIDSLIDGLSTGLVGVGNALKDIGSNRAFSQFNDMMRDRVAVRDENGKTTYQYNGKTLGATDYMSAYAKGMFSPEGFSEAFVGQLTSDFLPDLMTQLSDCIDTSSAGGKVAQVGLSTLQGMMNGQNAFQALSNGIWSSLLGWIQKDVQDQTEAERLEEIKEQLERQTEYIKDQLDYLHEVQLTMQAAFIDQQIASGSLTSANDMILTPNGQYSTAPDDYIMAMKHPEDLGSGTIKMSVTINNTVSDTVQTSVEQTTTTDGTKELLVTISKKVAQDAANGTNGWDAALIQRDSRMKGRYVS